LLDDEAISAEGVLKGFHHVEFGQAQVGTDVGEGGEGPLPGDELGHEPEAFTESPYRVFRTIIRS
jgi:hypothetical protein